MAFNLFDFSSALNPLGSITKPQAPPTQIGGATGGGMMPPTTSGKPLPQTPVAKKATTPTFVPERSQIDIRTKVQQNLPKLQEELKRQGVSDEDMGEILQGIVDASLQGTKAPTISASAPEGIFSKAISALPSNVAEPIERVGEAFQGGIQKAATNEVGWKGASGIGEAIYSPFAALDGKAAEIASKPVEILSRGIEEPLKSVGVTPEKAKDVASTILAATPFVKGAKVPLAKTAEMVNKPISFIKEKIPSITTKKPIVKPTLKIEKQINAKAADWEAPTQQAKVGVKKSAQILKRGEEIGAKPSDTLVRNGILAEDNIKGGNFDTLNVADSLRKDTIKVSSDIMRPALQEASTYTPKISVGEITQKALDSLEKNRTKLTSSAYETQKNTILNESKGLSEQYPEGLTLENLHDRKIVSDSAAKYNPIGTIADNNTAAGYKTLADTFRTTLEQKAPASIPIKKFNAELAKLFQASDFLESLHGKKAPISKGKQIANYAAKLTGATLGSGGGIVGSAAGYQLAGILENQLVNLPSPFKKKFLENLGKSSPDVFKTVEKYSGIKDFGYSLKNRPAIVKKQGDKYVVLQGTGRYAKADGNIDIFLPTGEKIPEGFTIVKKDIPNAIVKQTNLLSSRGDKGTNPKMVDFITNGNTTWNHLKGPKDMLTAPLLKK